MSEERKGQVVGWEHKKKEKKGAQNGWAGNQVSLGGAEWNPKNANPDQRKTEVG